MSSVTVPGAIAGAAAIGTTTVLAATVGATGDDVFTGTVIASFLLSGIVASAARPTSRAAGLLLVTGAVGEVFISLSIVAHHEGAAGWGLATRVAQCLTFVGWLATMAVYPDDRPDRVGRITTGVALGLALLLPLWWYADAVSASGVPLPWLYQLLFASPVLGLVVVARTYRRRGAEQRRQIRWLLLGMASAATFYAFSATPLNVLLPPLLDAVLFAAVTAFVAVSAAIGLVRPTIVDIDLVIRRFPVWVTLWLLITAAYVGATALLSVGASRHLSVQWAVLLTLGAAMVFEPARHWLERLADRAVFGRRLDGYDVLRDLSESLEASTRLDDVAQVITSAIAASVDASWVRLVSPDGDEHSEVHGVFGEPAGPPAMRVPVVHADTVVGVLECGPRRSGSYTDADTEIVASVARQAAIAVLNVQRAAQVAASRRRLVEAADTERARIERDLHDGVQQHLVALTAAIETARTAGDPAVVARALESAREIGRGAMVELRSVIGGILPPVLADGGLVVAVRGHAGQLPLPVAIDLPRGDPGRLGPETERAAYFFVSEALVNVVRHACATSACVSLVATGAHLEIAVSDNGRGFPPAARWRGLQGLQDRFASLDGEICVAAGTGAGSVVHGRLPL